MNAKRDKLALRRQSIRTLTDSELRIAHGGGTSAAPAPGTDRQTIGTSGTSVIHASSGTSVINPSGGIVANPSGGFGLNPSGGRINNPSGG
jgi:hypothetical protein